MRTLDEVPYVDTLDPRFGDDPDSLRDELLAIGRHERVVRGPFGAVLAHHADVGAALHDERLRIPGIDLFHIQGIESGPTYDWFAGIMFCHEGPAHLRLRRMVSRAFTPRAIEAEVPHMRTLLERLAPVDGRFDLVEAVATPFPIRVMTHMLGVPEGDVDRFLTWVDLLGYTFGVQLADHLDEVDDAVVELLRYLRDLVDASSPDDEGILPALLADEGDDRLDRGEVVTMVANLLVAGYDTTRHMLGDLVYATIRSACWDRSLTDPDRARAVVEEAGRYLPAAPGVTRIATEDLVLADVAVPAGTPVSLIASAANRDPDVFERPDHFDPSRTDAAPHFLFGAGPHYCLGAALARAELRTTLEVLAGRWSTLELAGPVTWSPPNLGIVGPTSLPVLATA